MAKEVVFLVASLRGGGAERVFVTVANELASRGHQVTLLTWNGDGPNAALLASRVRLLDLRLPLEGESYSKSATLRGILKTAKALRGINPDAVFSAPEFINLLAVLALTIGRIRARFFPTFHAAISLVSDRRGARIAVLLSRLVAGRATKAVAVSAGVGKELVTRGFPRTKVTVIHNPVPAADGRKTRTYAWDQQLNEMGEGPIIVTAGRLVPVKDHKTLLKAFALFRETRSARLIIFGEGPMADELTTFAREIGIASNVLFPGYVNDPQACYARADLFVLSSVSEGFGNVLVEAMGAGVPVVSTDAPYGPREILDNGRFGELVAVGDATGLAKAMLAAHANPVPADRLKERAADFDVPRIVDRYEALLLSG